MIYVLYDIALEEIYLFKRDAFLGFKYVVYRERPYSYIRLYLRQHPKKDPRFIVLGRLFGKGHNVSIN
jgi:hypothetical protein